MLLEGGVLGRADDMLIIRGVNVFPSAVEQIVRSFPEVLEYRMIADKVDEMDQLTVEIEDRLEQPRRVAEELRLRLGLKIDVQLRAAWARCRASKAKGSGSSTNDELRKPRPSTATPRELRAAIRAGAIGRDRQPAWRQAMCKPTW